MEKSALIESDVNYNWNFLNYPIHTLSAKPEQISNERAILLIHGFGASTDHWRFNIPVLSTKYEVHAMDLLGFGKSPKPQDVEYSGSLWKDQVVAYVKEKIKKPTIDAITSLISSQMNAFLLFVSLSKPGSIFRALFSIVISGFF